MTHLRVPPALVSLALAAALFPASPAGAALPPPETLRDWVTAMKASPKGPFIRIRWFCNDGTVQPPKAFACADHGGGIQHGQWNDRVVALRDGGYMVGNVLARLKGEDFVGGSADVDLLKQILLERFLMGVDDGWIFRGALSYRGALQLEDEQAGARRVVEAILGDAEWRDEVRFYLLRETVRLMPRELAGATATEVRELAVEVANADSGFDKLRAKIHNAPDAADAGAVRDHAAKRGKAQASELYARLAAAIDELYSAHSGPEELRSLAAKAEEAGESSVAALLREDADALAGAETPEARYAQACRLLGEYRARIGATTSVVRGHLLVLASLAMEDEAYAAGNTLAASLGEKDRATRLGWLRSGANGLYGAGLIGERQLRGLESSLDRLEAAGSPDVERYRKELRYLGRAPEWADRWVRFHFGDVVERWAAIEPLSHLYPQDRLRGSPLLFYGANLDGLVNDANRVAGIEHRIFGDRAGAGLRALNPGLARGTLLLPRNGHMESLRRDGIYLLPETVSELPPVAGILTRGEGSSLSHVQLLARNLGIPNVVVRESLLPEVQRNVGQHVVLAVSPGGVVQLERDGPEWDAVFGGQRTIGKSAEPGEDVVIRPDLEKLDLTVRDFVPLSDLRASDSGRLSGPKGANLGELRHNFGAAVPNGFVIPFGVFRELLEKPIEPDGPSVWDWMRARYDLIARLEDRPEAQQRVVDEFLARLRGWLTDAEVGEDFERRLAEMLEKTFGEDGSYGVFVRSDTNVEDLAGFTGAGLNKTVPNVVGVENITRAVREVWASPFTRRAYSWRQSHMEQPEYVFPAVVVQLAFPAEKSGVMVTADVDTGSREWLSVAVNEGVGGAVDGQATESLAVRADGSEVVYLARATAPTRTLLAPDGGVIKRPATGTETILRRGEIAQLVALAREAPQKFPSLREGGENRPADIEFAFKDGKLALLQLRPFVENKSARRNAHLLELDSGVGRTARVDLGAVARGR
jgi:hypothetical protein